MSATAVLPLACAVAAVWFWAFRAQPILHGSRNPRAELVGWLVTIEAVLAQFVGIAVAHVAAWVECYRMGWLPASIILGTIRF